VVHSTSLSCRSKAHQGPFDAPFASFDRRRVRQRDRSLQEPALGPLLIIPVLLPQFLAQLRIGFILRGLAQLPSDDIVVATVRDIRWRRVRATAATGTAAHTTTAAALSAALALAVALTLTFAALTLTLALSAAAALLASALTLAITSAFTFAAVLTGALARAAIALSTAGATAATSLTGDLRLLIAHTAVEDAERLIQLAIDLRRALTGRHRTAAATTASGAAR
jgi:hypothetical protein